MVGIDTELFGSLNARALLHEQPPCGPTESDMQDPETIMGSWTAARFSTKESRNRFLRAVSKLPIGKVEGAAMPQEACAALVRWRPGHFLQLNDIAYAHGGRIILPATARVHH